MGGTYDMIGEACVFKMGEVSTENITELEAKILPITPPEVLEEWKKVVEEDIHQIQEADTLCSKSYEQVSHASKTFMDDVVLKK